MPVQLPCALAFYVSCKTQRQFISRLFLRVLRYTVFVLQLPAYLPAYPHRRRYERASAEFSITLFLVNLSCWKGHGARWGNNDSFTILFNYQCACERPGMLISLQSHMGSAISVIIHKPKGIVNLNNRYAGLLCNYSAFGFIVAQSGSFKICLRQKAGFPLGKIYTFLRTLQHVQSPGLNYYTFIAYIH